MAMPGDLILVLGDNVKRSWKQIIYFNSGSRVDKSGKKAASSVDLPDFGGFDLADDLEIISDERGVRIAREEGD
jgi:cyanophycin synthetase